MRTSDSIDKIAAALVKAQSGIKAVGKGGYNTFDKYKYAKLEDYITATRDTLAANSLVIITGTPEIQPLDGRTTSKGNSENAVLVKLTMRLLHSSGQWIEIDQWGEGQDRGDKSTYKAVTGARKYGIANLLGLYTSDDPEDDGGNSRNDDKPSGNVAPARKAESLI
jgi:hypothetical protein